jgi:hypothetical protein
MVREAFREVGPLVLADTPGGREELLRLVDPRLVDIVDALRRENVIVAATSAYGGYGVEGSRPTLAFTAVRIRDADGRLAATAIITAVGARPRPPQSPSGRPQCRTVNARSCTAEWPAPLVAANAAR